MLKNILKKRLIISFITILTILIIYLIPNKKYYVENYIYKNNFNNIYLLNNNYLVRASSISNYSEPTNKIKEIIKSLTINDINNSDNLKPIIPKNTKLLDFSLKDNLLKINFSKELLNIDENNEEKMIESIIYSLTELKEIKNIMIFVEGNSLINLPNSKKILPIILNRDYGINKTYNITTFNNVSKYTLYYFININNNYNAVPVTLFTNDSSDKVEVIIKNLKSSSIYQTDLVSFLSNNTKLLDYEIEENKIKLNFNSYLLDDFYNEELLEEVKYAISETFKDSLNITDINILINGKAI